jgi:hypothetical protein
VWRELDGLEKALLCHHQLLQARCDDPALNAIFRSAQSTAEDCQKCIEAFSQQTVKFDRSLGFDPSGDVCCDVMHSMPCLKAVLGSSLVIRWSPESSMFFKIRKQTGKSKGRFRGLELLYQASTSTWG